MPEELRRELALEQHEQDRKDVRDDQANSIRIKDVLQSINENVTKNNGLGRYTSIANFSAVGLIGLLLYFAQHQGFTVLENLMGELKENRTSNADNIKVLREERTQDRIYSQKHAFEATEAIRDLAREIGRNKALMYGPIPGSPSKLNGKDG